jgi:hypothetical protein
VVERAGGSPVACRVGERTVVELAVAVAVDEGGRAAGFHGCNHLTSDPFIRVTYN